METFVSITKTHLNRLSSEDEEVLSPHHHEPHELLAKYLLNLIRLGVFKSILKVHTYAVRHNPNSYKLACLMAIDTRIEFIDASIWTFSFSFRLTMSGAKRSSLLLLLPDGMPTFHA